MTSVERPMNAPPAAERRRRFVSVGTKLTGAVLVVLGVVTAFAYLEVSRNEREQLLSAKERAATMVTELFAAGVTAPLSFGDDDGIREHLALLLENSNVVYAAVWRADGDRRGDRIGEAGRPDAMAEPPAIIPQDSVVTRTRAAIVVKQPVVSASNEVLGVAVVELSLIGENAAIAAAQRRTLATSLATGVGLAAVLLALSRLLVVRRLAQLAKAAKRLEDGEAVDATFETNDEVGDLARAFKSMSGAIASREAQISTRNRDLRRVLDNVAEGLMTVRVDGTMSDERSRSLEEWFGPPANGAKVFEYFETFAPAMGPLLRLGWAAFQDGFMPVEVVIDQMSRRFEARGRSYELDFSPIWSTTADEQALDEVLLVVRDVTAKVERERAEQSQRDALQIFRRILVDPAGFRGFLGRATRLVEAIEHDHGDATVGSSILRDLHTLKGDTSFFGIESVAAICHAIESRAQEDGRPPTPAEVTSLRNAWNQVRALAAELEAGNGEDRIEIHVEEYERHLAQLQARGHDEALVLAVRSWSYDFAERCLRRVAEQARSLARRVGKGDTVVVVRVAPPSLRLPPERWAPVWSVFSHFVRNALDHGIEPADEREAAGKPRAGRLEIALTASLAGVELRIADDGRGIRWESLRERAMELGLPHETQGDLEEALYADRVTTRTSATEISGRGLGMGAVRDVVRSCGGTIVTESQPGVGTAFSCRFPGDMVEWTFRTLPPAEPRVA
jgi:two-component system chemotaxis sensor kinase CheA